MPPARSQFQTPAQTFTSETAKFQKFSQLAPQKKPIFFAAVMSILAKLSKLQTDTISLLFILQFRSMRKAA